ncbi:hypothetical protein GN956_G9362 [Arapaima gigas]
MLAGITETMDWSSHFSISFKPQGPKVHQLTVVLETQRNGGNTAVLPRSLSVSAEEVSALGVDSCGWKEGPQIPGTGDWDKNSHRPRLE